ncbi:MAG: hypothetical protein HZB15_17835 [Actinobacteria bacterium]|nr:hypothetical protein [Actinomycetota bacterium]
MTVQAWFSTNDADVEPGTSVTLSLTVTNLGNSTDSFALNAIGLAAAWSTIRPAYITLFGGSQETVTVEVSPPRLPSTTAGPTQAEPDDVETAEVTLHVASTYDRRINMLQPAIRSRRRATYELMVDNAGNSQASCRMHLIDPTGRLDGDFDPPAVGIEPGGSSLVRLKMRAVRRQWQRRSRAVPFKVEADQQGAPTAEATASFIQAPMLPERLWSRLFGLLVLAALAGGAWLAVIEPAIDDAAQDAVADLEPATPVVTTIEVDEPPSTVFVEQPAEVDEGDPISIPLPAGTPYTVPGGKALLIDQAIVRNPYGDEGTATLNLGNVPFPFDLVDLQQGLDWNQEFLAPVRLASGEQAIFDVTCTANGQPGAAACATQALVVGRLVDA